MALEAAEFIKNLVQTNPTGNDPRSQGDDHIRLLKAVLQRTFPNMDGAVTKTAAQLNATPHNAETLAALLGGAPVYAQGDFVSQGVEMVTPAPSIALGWNATTRRVHAFISGSYVTGGFLVDQEFLGNAQSKLAAEGHQRLTGTLELHWGEVTITHPAAGYVEVLDLIPRGFVSVMGGWLQLINSSQIVAPHPRVSFPDPEHIQIISEYGAAGVFTYKWFAVGYR